MCRRVTLGVHTQRLVFTAILMLVAPRLAGAQSIPGGWSASDVGSVGASGASSGSDGAFTLRGGGADIWGTADGFHFLYRTMTGDGEVVTRMRDIEYVHAWSKAGVMMRGSLEAGATYAYMLASAGKGTAFQRRQYTNDSATGTSGAGTAGYYLKVTRSGNVFNAYESADGASWSWVGGEWVDMPPTIYVGVAVTSHQYGVLTTAMFSDTDVNEWSPTLPSSLLPSEWFNGDVGAVAASGWAAASGDEFHVAGSGTDIWNTEDSFQYAYRSLSGDGSIMARVVSLDWADAWTKGGVMMRESLSPSSRHAMMTATAGKGFSFQRRPSFGADSFHTAGATAPAPSYVRLVRSGDTFIGYSSADGSNWSEVGREYIPMAPTIYVGLAVTSHANGAIAAATFSGVEVVKGAQAPAEPTFPEGAPPPASGTAKLRVMHWNVHHGGIGTDGYYNPDRVAAWIASVNPDIATLNEVDDEGQLYNILSALNARTGTSWYVAFAAKNAVLTRLPARQTSTCGYGYTYQSAPQVSIAVNGQSLNIWSVHLDADADYARLYEIAVLQSCLDAGAANIIAGDFNMQAGSLEYSVTVAPGYIDAWDTARNLGATLNYAGNCDGCTRNTRIDYLFSSNVWFLTVESAQMIDTRDGDGFMPSDHKPLVVTYRVQ